MLAISGGKAVIPQMQHGMVHKPAQQKAGFKLPAFIRKKYGIQSNKGLKKLPAFILKKYGVQRRAVASQTPHGS